MYQFHVADDHPLFRNAMADVIDIHFPNSSISKSSSLDETIQALKENPELDILFLDLNMPGSEDLYGLISVRRNFPEIPVVIVSGWQDQQVIARAIGHGASGFIPKSLPTETIVLAIKEVLSGEHWTPIDPAHLEVSAPDEGELDIAKRLSTLTTQQHKVLSSLKEGQLNKQIAYDLGITEATVKAHISAILKKLQVANRTQAVIALNKISLNNDNLAQKL